jgi:type IV pilus assembly protein PilE
LPSYQEYMRRGRRAEARAGLLQAAQWLERVATAQGQYLSKLNDFPESLKTVPSNSYDISLASSNASAYTLQADPKNAQANDRCGGFTLTQSGERGLTSTSTNSYQFAFNRLDMMSSHELQGVVDEDIDRG